MCEKWGGRPAEDLYPEIDDPNFQYSLNTFVLHLGINHEADKLEKQKREKNRASTWGSRR